MPPSLPVHTDNAAFTIPGPETEFQPAHGSVGFEVWTLPSLRRRQGSTVACPGGRRPSSAPWPL
eukprot:6189394-Pleurochrysis_carterae.AAC.2